MSFFRGMVKAAAGKIVMPKKEFVKEHTHLLKVLRSKSHKDDLSEARSQAAELKKYTK